MTFEWVIFPQVTQYDWQDVEIQELINKLALLWPSRFIGHMKIQDHFIISSEKLNCDIFTYITITLKKKTNTGNYTAKSSQKKKKMCVCFEAVGTENTWLSRK